MRKNFSSRKRGLGYLTFIAFAALVVGVTSVWPSRLVTPAHAQTPSPAPLEIQGEHSTAASHSTRNFSEIASRSQETNGPAIQVAIHRPVAGRAGESEDESDGFDPADSTFSEQWQVQSRKRHRVRRAEFPGGADNGSVIPPDTQGTVGPNHLMVVLNSNLTIESRTGVVLEFGSDCVVLVEPRRDQRSVRSARAVRSVCRPMDHIGGRQRRIADLLHPDRSVADATIRPAPGIFTK